MINLNQDYFNILLKKSKQKKEAIDIIFEPECGIQTALIPLAVANKEQLSHVDIVSYDTLSAKDNLRDFKLRLIKMHAGLGTSVERDDLLKDYTQRDYLGSKGTDLFFEFNKAPHSVLDLQLKQAKLLKKSNLFKDIIFQCLVNEDTQRTVQEQVEREASGLDVDASIVQEKMPTLDLERKLTEERKAPAGHGFIGFYELARVFNNKVNDEIIAIGNGEDLNSTPDENILSYVVEKNIPILMITTTKTINDKKGGQISLVTANPPYVSIVEKAQAQEANQMDYFEKLGLREQDNISYFNTNLVVINSKALSEVFQTLFSNYTYADFIKMLSPDLISNVKKEADKQFIQLESALASVILSLDKYMRTKFEERVVSFLNLSQEHREKFFMPIKTREDYERIKEEYVLNNQLRFTKK